MPQQGEAGSKAIAILLQADMWTDEGTAHFTDTKRKLAQLSIAFPGQFLLVNGDTHLFKVDKLREEPGDRERHPRSRPSAASRTTG